jgi:putative ABC transport system substrate-binding protein
MNWRILNRLIAIFCLATVSLADAQQAKKVARVGYLGNTAATSAPDEKVFGERLRELGYIEGQSVTIERRYFGGTVERLSDLVSELIRLNCDVIVAIGNEATGAAKNATKVIPIVMASTNEAVRSGFVASLARPGGNVTGMSSFGGEIYGKRLELLKEIVPKLSRVGFVWSPTSPVSVANLKETQDVARYLRIDVQSVEVNRADEIDSEFQRAKGNRTLALLVDGSGFFTANQKQLVELTAKHRLPAVYGNKRYVEAGGLMSYAGDRSEQYRRAAEFVDKILQGAKPADLPVERPKKFEFVVNLKAAKQIGLTIPPNVLVRADRVIR